MPGSDLFYYFFLISLKENYQLERADIGRKNCVCVYVGIILGVLGALEYV